MTSASSGICSTNLSTFQASAPTQTNNAQTTPMYTHSGQEECPLVFYHSPDSSYFVGVAFGLDSLNLQINQTKVPETTAPITNATVIILKNKFQISTRLSRYSPASAGAAKTYSTDGITIKIVITIQSPTTLFMTSCYVVT